MRFPRNLRNDGTCEHARDAKGHFYSEVVVPVTVEHNDGAEKWLRRSGWSLQVDA
jgi:hypothetical protein